MRTQQDSICLQAKKTALAISKSANILILNFLGSRTGRKKLRCLSYPICGIVLWQPWQSKAPLLTSWLPALWVLPCSKLSSALPSEWPSTHKVSGHLSASYHLEDKTHTQVLSLYLNPATILNTFLFSEQAIPACLPACLCSHVSASGHMLFQQLECLPSLWCILGKVPLRLLKSKPMPYFP